MTKDERRLLALRLLADYDARTLGERLSRLLSAKISASITIVLVRIQVDVP